MKTSAFPVFIALAIIAFCASPATSMARRSRPPNNIKSHRDSPPATNKVDALMQTYDQDHDGQLDQQEMKALQVADATDVSVALSFDRDHNGSLSMEEIVAWRRAETSGSRK